jgi:hypothetical protein
MKGAFRPVVVDHGSVHLAGNPKCSGESMSIINKPPETLKRQAKLDEPVALAVEKNRTFLASTPGHVVNSRLKMLLLKDPEFRHWQMREQETTAKKESSKARKSLAKV